MTTKSQKNTRKNPFTVYKSYSFIDKDPIIDRIHTMIDTQHLTYKKVAEESGISAGTLYQWIGGTTRRPQFCTVVAVIRALGYDVQVTEPRARQRNNGIVVQPAAAAR